MNNAHLHLIINHLPLTFVISGLILMLCGFLFKSEIIQRTAFAVYFMAALVGFATFYTGEGAKKHIAGMKGIDGHLMATHQETAYMFLMFLYILGMVSFIGLWANWQKKPYSKIIAFLAMGCLIGVLYYAIPAGATGGEIRHPEIRELNAN